MISIGQKLKDARIQRKLSIEEIAIATKIKPQFLEAIENQEYSKLPSPAYAQGFVKNYADFLGLPKAQTVAIFKRDYDEKKAMKVLPDRMSERQKFPTKNINVGGLIIGLFGIFILFVFLFFQIRNAYISPSVSIAFPAEGSTVSSTITIIGKTDSNAIVTINNEPVFVEENGEFRKIVTLFPGKTSITIKSKLRTGKQTVLKRNFIVK